jgi:hypothetical protein
MADRTFAFHGKDTWTSPVGDPACPDGTTPTLRSTGQPYI